MLAPRRWTAEPPGTGPLHDRVDHRRRGLLGWLGWLGGVLVLPGGLLPAPVAAARAAPAGSHAFAAESLEATLDRLGISDVSASPAIDLQLPDVAEDGAAVQMRLSTTLRARRALLLVRRNRIPLVAEFEFVPGTLPFVATRIKMAEDSDVVALVEADGRWYSATRFVRVTLGGCGG